MSNQNHAVVSWAIDSELVHTFNHAPLNAVQHAKAVVKDCLSEALSGTQMQSFEVSVDGEDFTVDLNERSVYDDSKSLVAVWANVSGLDFYGKIDEDETYMLVVDDGGMELGGLYAMSDGCWCSYKHCSNGETYQLPEPTMDPEEALEWVSHCIITEQIK